MFVIDLYVPYNLTALSPPFSFATSSLAIRDPNCIARFGSSAVRVSPTVLLAARQRSSSFSPMPRGSLRSAFSCVGTLAKNLKMNPNKS